MMQIKPKKRIYENQAKILEGIKTALLKLYRSLKCEIYLVGSSITGEFGKYLKEFQGHKGSDIDLIIFIKEKDIPSDWKYLNTEKKWWKLYRAGKLVINNNQHKIDVMVVKENQNALARKRMNEIWEPLKIK
jgi:predicted nucleotidyltransferase